MKESSLTQDVNNRDQIIITKNDLPLACPLPEMALWNAHPRVYLPIEATGAFTCPYCSAHYVLKDFKRDDFGSTE